MNIFDLQCPRGFRHVANILPHIRKEKVTQNRRHFKHSTAYFIHRAQLITAIKPERASFNMIMDYYGDTERTRHSQG